MITTLPELRKALELHYGKREIVEGKTVVKPREYDEVTRRDIGAYIVGYKGDLAALFEQVTLNVSTAYGRLPDKAQVHKAALDLQKQALNRPEARVVSKHQNGDEGPTDDEREAVQRGLADILDRTRYGRHVERSEPYKEG